MSRKPTTPDAGAVIYTRVSTQEQQENTSLAAQFAACAREAQRLGLPVIGHFEEVESGGLYLARPKLQAALELIEEGKASHFIVFSLDRAGRDVGDLIDVRKRVQRAGAKMVFANGASFEGTPFDDEFYIISGIFPQMERREIRTRTMRGRLRRIAEGHQTQRNRPAFGYRIITKNDVIRGLFPLDMAGKYLVVESETEAVRAIFERYRETKSLRGAIEKLTADGHTTRSGKPFTPHSLRCILSNPIYTGKATYGKTRRVVDQSRLHQEKGIAYQVPVPREEWHYLEAPRLISDELFNEVGELLSQGRSTRSGARRYALTSLAYCPECGRKISFVTDRAKRKRAKCPGASRQPGYDAPLCHWSEMPGTLLEFLALDALVWLLENPNIASEAESEYAAQKKQSRESQSSESQIKNFKKQIARLEEQENRAVKFAIETGAASFATAAKEAAQKRVALEAQLSALLDVPQLVSLPQPPQKAVDALIEILRHGAPTVQNECVQNLVQRIVPIINQPRKKVVELILKTNEKGPRYVLTHTLTTNKTYRAERLQRGELNLKIRDL